MGPYKEMGYYGYTYGGPPTGTRRHQSSYQEMGDQETLGDDLEEASPAPQSCETTSWGDWSDCSTACGTGTRTRTRRYVEQRTSSCSADLLQTGQCEQRSGCARSTAAPKPRRRMRMTTRITTTTTSRPDPSTSQPRLLRRPTARRLPGAQRQVGRRRKLKAGDQECEVAAWTEWSPCSVTCSQGYKIRTRVYTMPFVPNRICGNKNNFNTETECLSACHPQHTRRQRFRG